MSAVLWIVQGLLALLFLFSGAMKLVQPIEVLQKRFPLPGGFVRFIGTAEVFGALGLTLPTLLDIWPFLTLLAAVGLGIIMVGATVMTWTKTGPVSTFMPLVTGLLLTFVLLGRLFQ